MSPKYTDTQRVQSFWAKVNKTETCWLWTGANHGGGYGTVNIGGQFKYAHRLSYEWVVGPIPQGLELDHLCRTPACVNPAHLEPVTHRVNTLRGETFGAENVAKTHCAQGHPYDEANTFRPARGDRQCRECGRTRDRERYWRNNPIAKKKSRYRTPP